jgi:ERF superfamily
MSAHSKLANARVMLQERQLTKTGHNKFAGYKYFELGDFMPAINDIFNKLGLCGVVSYGSDVATLTITDTQDGTQLQITSPMAEANLKGAHPIQNLGAVETYTRRYLWVTAMEIVEHDALDASEPSKPVKIISPMQGATEEVPQEDLDYLRELSVEIIDMVNAGGVIEAYKRIQGESLDNEQMIALWAFLPANVRSKLKKAKEAANEQQT